MPERGPKKNSWKTFLLGSGIGKSISPAIQNRAFREVGLAVEYQIREVRPFEFNSKMNEIRCESNVLGFNVTIPYKEVILSLVDALDSQTEVVRAVNTVLMGTKNRMYGYNTDIDGAVASLSKLDLLRHSGGRRAMIIGAGGAARGCLFAILNNGFDSVTILNRNFERAKKLVSDFSNNFPEKRLHSNGLTASHLISSLRSENPDLMINTIPSNANFPFEPDLNGAPSSMRVLDLNYRGRIPMIEKARKRNLVCSDGLTMLVEQAARSFEIWTGISAPRKTMMLEAERALAIQSKA